MKRTLKTAVGPDLDLPSGRVGGEGEGEEEDVSVGPPLPPGYQVN